MGELRRALVKQLRLNGRPTLVQTEALDHACRLTLFAERGAADPATKLADWIRLDNSAVRARKRLIELATGRRQPSLQDYLAGREGGR